MLLINAIHKATGDIKATKEGSTVGAYKVEKTTTMYLFDESKLYKLVAHDGTDGYYNEYKPAYGTMVKYDKTTGSGDSATTTTIYKTWTAGTPSWE